ncbi:MAG TPA: hypothetical protein DD436_10785, partial [Erythrobacter sp.]|nr:hypothetical protein [Erythrobacter sp.]
MQSRHRVARKQPIDPWGEPMKAMSLAAALAFGTCLSAPATAQTTTETAPMDLTFERVFASPGLDGPTPRKVKLS